MNLEERIYSVLVVSAAEKMNTSLSTFLAQPRYAPVKFVSGVGSAKRALAERDFDFVIVNSPLPDDTGLRFAIDTAASVEAVILLLVRSELFDEFFEQAAGNGVFTLYKPLSRPIFALALGWMESARERLRRQEKKTLSFEEKMEEIRLVNRAKWLLISELKMDEPQAHRYIEKQAMDRCISKGQIAKEIINTYS